MSVIITANLCKRYGRQEVLHNLNLEIGSGQLVGFLGPNGAGKTTTIRILLGLLRATSGDAHVFGKSVERFGKQIRHEIGYLPGDVHFYSNMTGRATLDFLARCRRRDCRAEILRLADVLDLDLRKSVRKYSTGMRQKLGLIQALMHRPQLLILDEPTNGLDPLVRKSLFEELKSVIQDGRSVVFSSHSLNEVEQLCDQVIILRSGEIVEQQSIEVLKSKALRRVEFAFCEEQLQANSLLQANPLPSALQISSRSPGLIKGTWTGGMEALLSWLQPLQVTDLIVERPDLNDLFMTYYSRQRGLSD
ncbi:MAG: ABC transporter ATP-binding protein [Planctomycetales bacterium]|nr:ABC transporter ATP-binding protein [Planctomycetales bacterium]